MTDPPQLRAVDVQQRQARDGTDDDPRPDDVGQRRRDDEVGPGVLELPAEAPQDRAVELGAGEGGDDVGVHGPGHGGDVVERAEHGDAEVLQFG